MFNIMFAKDMLWGAATAAYQIEGSWNADGKGESVWDAMCSKPGAVLGGASGNVACDHYRRFRDDVGLMKQIGLQGYRFSISWPRVLPEGRGAVNGLGLAFYDQLVDELLAAGIKPMATLFHWDFPRQLFHQGGWLNRDSAQWFADYAQVIGEKLGDRVTHWATINEPSVFVHLGHCSGDHAPGIKLPPHECLVVAHNVLRAHGMAVQALRATVSPDAKIGYAPAVNPHFPMTESQEDIDASYEMMFAAGNSLIGDVSWWMDPVFLGHYPESGLRAYFPHLPHFPESDMDVISQPVDFLAYNCYTGQPTRASSNGPEYVPFPYNHPMGSLNWLIKADDAIYWGCRHFTKRYGDRPIYITENGFCGNDWVDRDGRVRDGGRIDFTRSYLLGLRRAASEGINVAGYYHWSLMDNFEWAEGYKPRFGLIHIDWETQQRTLKDSAIWYSKVIASNGGALDEPVAKLIEG